MHIFIVKVFSLGIALPPTISYYMYGECLQISFSRVICLFDNAWSRLGFKLLLVGKTRMYLNMIPQNLLVMYF